jgi:hypothetical protein
MPHGELLELAVTLFSQQVWCWGQDILRPKGNWLKAVGFHRIAPPSSRKDCPSVYSLDLPESRCVILRGFGVFYGDQRYGGVFLPRYQFRPKYTKHSRLIKLPWSHDDLPDLRVPKNTDRINCASLTLDLIDWIRSYEVRVAETLGRDYRRSTLAQWGNDSKPVIPAEEMAHQWRLLGIAIAGDLPTIFPNHTQQCVG